MNTKVKHAGVKKTNIYIQAHVTEPKIVNVKTCSGEYLSGLFKRTFSSKPFELSGYTHSEQENIRMETVELGMSKAAVISAIGYPKNTKLRL